jgi:putative hydrolase of HD superfamily
MDTDGLVDFIVEAGRLKRLPRTGWVESGVPDPESVADHSFRVTLIAIILADAQKLDALKVVRMALLHDLAEGEIGDLTPTQKGLDDVGFRQRENEVMSKLLSKLPADIRPVYSSAWTEFSGGKSPEARLVRDCDKLEMIIQASEYQEAGNDRTKLMQFWHAEINGDDTNAIRDAVKIRSWDRAPRGS